MTSQALTMDTDPQDHPLCKAFLRWQCRVRQMGVREFEGRPIDAIQPHIFLNDDEMALGQIITVFNKSEDYSKTPEMLHIAKQTHDPAQRREKALQFFSEYYYQKIHEFTDHLTASFVPDSKGAKEILQADKCRLLFEAFGQQFDLTCQVNQLDKGSPNYQATLAHNQLFNSKIHPDTIILEFVPDWERSKAIPEIMGA